MKRVLTFITEWATVALIVLLGLCVLKMAQLEAELAEARLEAATETAARESAARAHETQLAARERTHAAEQQTKEGNYVQAKAALAADLRRERAATGQLRQQLQAATASGGAGGATDPVVCQRTIDRLDELGRLAGEGLELLQEGRGLLRERDLDVQRLLDQVRIDRAAIQP
ncbi:hypothetical protein [Comamonas antarctica]|uniref:hypothetical protein n=1 Tax=Comamonas antarctica TaxID=2743470 RepID=UPI0028E30A7F|nr:hypothetical protein [Comamonas antarctica]